MLPPNLGVAHLEHTHPGMLAKARDALEQKAVYCVEPTLDRGESARVAHRHRSECKQVEEVRVDPPEVFPGSRGI